MQDNIVITEEEQDAVNTDNTAPDTAEQQESEKLYSQQELDELLESERKSYESRLAEAEKLAAMSDTARSDYMRDQLDKQLSEREAAVAKRELMADAAERFGTLGLPKQLCACLNYSDRELCDQSFETVAKAFESAVTSAVNERVRGKTPKLAYGGPADAFLDGLGC